MYISYIVIAGRGGHYESAQSDFSEFDLTESEYGKSVWMVPGTVSPDDDPR